ncbi:MAG: ribonuclease R [Desulfobulbaceae bacterium]|nr:ribonuclease R [Desulfobulbaceae bacterium]MDY0352148.1 ribonuclease R [Desulfobulbaceae bacterium]
MKKRIAKQPSRRTLKTSRHKGHPERLDHRTLLADRLLAFLAGKEKSVGLGEMIIGLDLPRHERTSIREILAGLEKKGRIIRQGNRYLPAGDAGLIRAVLELNSRGFGFALVAGAAEKGKDPFISRSNLNGASHGDTVLIRIISADRARPEARVVKVLARGITTLCGMYTSAGKKGFVTPDNERLPFSVLIRPGNSLGARPETAVLVEMLDYGGDGRPPEGRIIEILGDPLSARVQIRMAIEQFELARTFPSRVEQEAAGLAPLTEWGENRLDLRHVAHVTIDGDDARDFDDAVAVERRRSGYRLYVSIADVSHYVPVGSPLDTEAYRRGTSVYFPDLVIPMLPERLSNDLCSLVPDQDRPAFTAILDFNNKGQRIGQEFGKSIIRSRQRFTYTTVRRILYDDDRKARKAHQPLLPMLDAAKTLADLLLRRRMKRGAIGFDIPESAITLAEDKVAAIGRAERNRAHKLVEEFMLAANEAVAETMDRKGRPVLYRIHERPDPIKVEQFTETTVAMGLSLPRFELSPSWFAGVVKAAEHSPAQYVINNLMLRTMQQARYSPENNGHFGLAAEHYLHFTSPIRRYPDLVAHRALHNLLDRSGGKGEQPSIVPGGVSLEEAALHLSRRERISVDVERNIRSRLSCLFLLDHVGEEFDAIISGVGAFGLFVELLESFISGAVPVAELTDDYYILDNRAHKYIGERTGRTYQLGDLIKVRLEHVDILAKKITFLPAATDN